MYQFDDINRLAMISYKSEVDCPLIPFSTVHSLSFTKFRLNTFRVYQIQRIYSDAELYEMLTKALYDEIYGYSIPEEDMEDLSNRLQSVISYLNSKDKTMTDLGVVLSKQLILQTKKLLNLTDD